MSDPVLETLNCAAPPFVPPLAETVKRDWRLAKVWLARELAPGTPSS
jgi:hypothetical protein